MVREALTGYWSLVSGLTEVTLERARAAAKQLVSQGDATREQVSGLAQEIVDTGKANREALVNLVRYETERAAGRLGFASSDEVSTLQARVRELERSISQLRAAADRAESVPPAQAGKPPGKKAAKTADAKAGPAKAGKATKAAGGVGPAKATKAAGGVGPAKAAKKASAKKAPPGRRSTSGSGS